MRARPRERLRSCLRTLILMPGSRPLVGSSAMRRAGFRDTPIEMTARSHIPPDMRWGYDEYTDSGSGNPMSPRDFRVRLRASSLPVPCIVYISSICFPIFITGSKDTDGLWGMRAIRAPLIPFISFLPRVRRSVPSNQTSPLVSEISSSRRIIEWPSTDLPHPDSPMTATCSSGPISSDTLSRALKRPSRVGN